MPMLKVCVVECAKMFWINGTPFNYLCLYMIIDCELWYFNVTEISLNVKSLMSNARQKIKIGKQSWKSTALFVTIIVWVSLLCCNFPQVENAYMIYWPGWKIAHSTDLITLWLCVGTFQLLAVCSFGDFAIIRHSLLSLGPFVFFF